MISSGSIIAASVLLSRALQPIEQLVGAWPSLTVARQAYNSLNEMFAGDTGEEERKLLLPDPMGSIELANVALRTPAGDGFIVRGISFAVAPGQIVGLIGPSGAGKSTIARLIMPVSATRPTRSGRMVMLAVTSLALVDNTFKPRVWLKTTLFSKISLIAAMNSGSSGTRLESNFLVIAQLCSLSGQQAEWGLTL